MDAACETSRACPPGIGDSEGPQGACPWNGCRRGMGFRIPDLPARVVGCCQTCRNVELVANFEVTAMAPREAANRMVCR